MINLHKIGRFLLAALPWALLILAILFGIQKCEGERRNAQNITTLQGEISHYKNKVGGLTATVGTLQLTKRQLEQTILKKNDTIKKLSKGFSNINTVVIAQTQLVFDTIPVPFEVPVPVEFERSGKKKTDWYTLNYQVNQNGLSLSKFETWTETTTITGFKRKWLLGRQYAVTDVTHSNPHIKTTHIQAVDVVVPVQWHETRLFNIGVGLLAGAIIFGK